MRLAAKGEKLTKIRRQIAARNRRFQKLTKAEQRVAIAKDVIAQVKAKKFNAASTYFDLPSDVINDAQRANLDIGECIAQVGCTVCGIGSLFASATLNYKDRPKLKDLTCENYWRNGDHLLSVHREDEVEYLRKWFSEDQLDLIEDYFEGREFLEGSPISEEDNDNQRLIMIMENIISNKGRFNPYKGAHKVDKNGER